MSQCLRILAPKLWIMSEAWCRQPKLQNFDAIIRNSVLTSNAHFVWRALLLAFIVLPIGLSLAYKVFVGRYSTHNLDHHISSYGMTGAPGLTRNTVIKFGPSYMTNATLPFILVLADYQNLHIFRKLMDSTISSSPTHHPLFLTPHCQMSFWHFSRACRKIPRVLIRSPQMCRQRSRHTILPSRRRRFLGFLPQSDWAE